MDEVGQGKRGRQLLVAVAVVVATLAGAAAWRLLFPRNLADKPPVSAGSAAPEASPGSTKESARKLASVPNLVMPTGTGDDIPVVPPGPDDPRPDGPLHFHPITPEHVRLQEENQLIGSLNGAMDVKDPAGMRRLLKQYRDKYPDDTQRLQDGYQLIIDCLEHPGDATRRAAQRYWDQERGSILRRYVRRHCLE